MLNFQKTKINTARMGKNTIAHSMGLYFRTFDPSRGGMGRRLNKARKRLKYARKNKKLSISTKIKDSPSDVTATIKFAIGPAIEVFTITFASA